MLRGEIYVVDLGPPNGRELGGVRPVVVVSSDLVNQSPFMVAVVVGDTDPKVKDQEGVAVAPSASGFSERIVFLHSQLRTLDPSRFPAHATGTVPPDQMKAIDSFLRTFLNLPPAPISARPA